MSKSKAAIKSFARVSGLAFILVGGGLALAYFQTDLFSASRQCDDYAKQAKDLGLFSNLDEAKPLFAVDANENGAPLMLEAGHLDFSQKSSIVQSDLPTLLTQLEPKLKLVEAAVAKKRIIFKHNKIEPTLFVGDGSNLRNWIKSLTELSKHTLEAGNLEATSRLLILAARLVDHCDEDRTFVAVLGRLSNAQVLESRLREIIETKGADKSWVAMVDQVLTVLDRPYDLRTALSLQHLSNIAFVERLEAHPLSFQEARSTRDLPAPVRYSKFLPRFYSASLSRIHQRYVETVKRWPKDPFDFIGASAACEVGDEIQHREAWSYTVLHSLDIDFRQFVKAVRKEQSIRNVLVIATKSLQGDITPDKFNNALSRFMLDIDGKPIRCKKDGNEWIVYSIWQDDVDNGGKPIDKGRGDWTVRVPTLR